MIIGRTIFHYLYNIMSTPRLDMLSDREHPSRSSVNIIIFSHINFSASRFQDEAYKPNSQISSIRKRDRAHSKKSLTQDNKIAQNSVNV